MYYVRYLKNPRDSYSLYILLKSRYLLFIFWSYLYLILAFGGGGEMLVIN